MKRIFTLTILAVSLIFNFSCEIENQESQNETQQVAEHVEQLGKDIQTAFGYTSIDEMQNNGWEKLQNLAPNTTTFKSKTAQSQKAASNLQERLSFEHLKGLGFNEHKLRELVKNKYGRNPDGISVNSENRFSGRNPTITDQYSRFAYIKTATPKITILSENTEQTKVIYDHTFYNYSDQVDTHTVVRRYDRGTSTNWSVTESVGIKIGGKVGIPLVTEGSIEISVGLSATQGGSQSNTVSDEIRSTIVVPARSKRRVVMIEQSSYAKVKYDIPVYTSGYLGANFGKRVNGHYYWFMGVNRLIGSNGRDNQLGFITSNRVYKAEVFAYGEEEL